MPSLPIPGEIVNVPIDQWAEYRDFYGLVVEKVIVEGCDCTLVVQSRKRPSDEIPG